VNTTDGPREVPEANPHHTLNTSRVVEEDLTYVDEAELAFVLPGDGWYAKLEGRVVPLVAWVVQDDGKTYGVAVGEDGGVDVHASVEDLDGFVRYEKQEER
jgi:hypothetical protein